MKIFSVDVVNSFLIILAAVAAFFFTFEVFLFSYAFFGPLHYLTEIAWLEKRDFFVTNKKFVWFLVFAGCVLFGMHLGLFHLSASSVFTIAALLLAVSFSTALLFVRQWSPFQKRVIWLLVFSVLLLTYVIQAWAIFFAVLLPTIIHVSVFTLLFMVYGAQKSRSAVGYMNVLLYGLASVALVFLTIEGNDYSLSTYITAAYRSFEGVNLEIMNLLNIGNADIQWSIYESAAGLSIMRFLAFAYTYHYLNWFSKVNVIAWHKISQSKAAFIIAAWVGAVSLYVVDYEVGLFALYFLSLTHVLLEFPLNQQSIVGIYSEVKARVRT